MVKKINTDNCDCCSFETELEPCGKFKLCRYCLNTNLGLTVTEPSKYSAEAKILASSIGWIANDLHSLLMERSLTKRQGRPPRDLPIEEISKKKAAGQSWKQLSREYKIPVMTLRTRVKQYETSSE